MSCLEGLKHRRMETRSDCRSAEPPGALLPGASHPALPMARREQGPTGSAGSCWLQISHRPFKSFSALPALPLVCAGSKMGQELKLPGSLPLPAQPQLTPHCPHSPSQRIWNSSCCRPLMCCPMSPGNTEPVMAPVTQLPHSSAASPTTHPPPLAGLSPGPSKIVKPRGGRGWQRPQGTMALNRAVGAPRSLG